MTDRMKPDRYRSPELQSAYEQGYHQMYEHGSSAFADCMDWPSTTWRSTGTKRRRWRPRTRVPPTLYALSQSAAARRTGRAMAKRRGREAFSPLSGREEQRDD
jgi:hypothetical protein